MSKTAHISGHRRPRRRSGSPLLRTGVAGGVFSTLAVTAAAFPAHAAERPATRTAEASTALSASTAGTWQAAEATQTVAVRFGVEAARSQAAETAMKRAEERAEERAEAEARRRAAAREARAERAAREAERSPLVDTASTAGGSTATLVDFLRAQVGKPYVMGASGPNAYDCSGLTQTAFRQIGVSLPRTSQDQSTTGTPVSLDSLQPGDLLYWGGAGSAYHIAVYIGDGRYVGAQNPSTDVVERSLDYDMPSGAVRVL